jgi:hypothetical protein
MLDTMQNKTLLRESINALKQQWQQLVIEYSDARRDAERRGVADEALRNLDLVYEIKIDLAFSELKIAESLEVLSRCLQNARNSGSVN